MREKMSDGQTSDWQCGGKRIPYLRQEPLCREISRLRFARNDGTFCCATVEVLHRTSTVGRSKAPSLPIKALSFCRPTELRAERWYAVPKGAEAAGLGRFLELTGLWLEGS